MSTICDFCGYKSNEVKTGGEVSEKGRKITLKVEDPDDLTRDILKVYISMQFELIRRVKHVLYTFRNCVSICNKAHWEAGLLLWKDYCNKPMSNYGGEFIIPIPIQSVLKKRRNLQAFLNE